MLRWPLSRYMRMSVAQVWYDWSCVCLANWETAGVTGFLLLCQGGRSVRRCFRQPCEGASCCRVVRRPWMGFLASADCYWTATWPSWHRVTTKRGQVFDYAGNTPNFRYMGCMFEGVVGISGIRGVAMKSPMLLFWLALPGLAAQAALAFQEGTPGSSPEKPAAQVQAVEPPKGAEQGKGLSLKTPELSLGQGTGTEVRIPGFGKVGVLPKLDFGLELLYGATEAKGLPDKAEPSDVQIRGTIKHRF
jgi:hypothetical protein